MNVSTHDVARMALRRLEHRTNDLASAMSDLQAATATANDELRELLSYCESQAQHSGYALEESGYADIAKRLRGILDGEL
ncbi:MAG TPA: hypothetical protein VJ777_14910 [Mycobacterium sp.]|nr:hypothetical protein [Mycobacterium sp.]